MIINFKLVFQKCLWCSKKIIPLETFQRMLTEKIIVSCPSHAKDINYLEQVALWGIIAAWLFLSFSAFHLYSSQPKGSHGQLKKSKFKESSCLKIFIPSNFSKNYLKLLIFFFLFDLLLLCFHCMVASINKDWPQSLILLGRGSATDPCPQPMLMVF